MAAAPDPELVMAACRSDTNKLKDLLLLLLNDMVSAEQQGARETRVAAVPVQQLDPQLVMAARRGDVNKLKELLGLNDDGDEEQEQVVVVEVDRRPPPPPPPGAAAASKLRLDDGGVTMDGDSLLHIVASCGDSEGYRECAKLLLVRGGKREKLAARNQKDDTPLHSAAGAGNAQMVSCLLASAGDDDEVKELLRMRNKRRETALCEAVRAASTAAVDQMMSLDPELACIPGADEEEGAPPLYLAVSFGEMNIAHHLFNKSKGKLSYSGPHGRNVLHEAVSRGGQVLSTILKWFKDDDVHQEVGGVDYKLLLPQLTLQKDQLQGGSTPLHLAALYEASETTLLLDANSCAAYQPDNQGLYPIHIAAMADNLEAVKALLQRCPDCATLRDAQGATFLHVAVDKESRRVVSYACLRRNNPQFSSVLNVQDNDGDTALHRAVRVGNLGVFNLLIGNRLVHLDVSNDKGLAPLDIASLSPLPPYSYVPTYVYKASPSGVMRTTLLIVGAHGGGRQPNLLKHIPKRDEDKEVKSLTDATSVMGVVSVLVATVTFAAAFTLPGSYRSADDAAAAAANPHGHAVGTPLLAAGRNYAFIAFIIADTLAFICSSGATFALLYAGLPGIKLSVRYLYFSTSYTLLVSTATSLLVTFALGLYLVLAPVAFGLAVAVCLLCSTPLLLAAQENVRMAQLKETVSNRFGAFFQVPKECWLRLIFFAVVMPYWSFVVIFSLPAVIIAFSALPSIWKKHA